MRRRCRRRTSSALPPHRRRRRACRRAMCRVPAAPAARRPPRVRAARASIRRTVARQHSSRCSPTARSSAPTSAAPMRRCWRGVGLKPTDVVTAINGTPLTSVSNPQQLMDQLQSSSSTAGHRAARRQAGDADAESALTNRRHVVFVEKYPERDHLPRLALRILGAARSVGHRAVARAGAASCGHRRRRAAAGHGKPQRGQSARHAHAEPQGCRHPGADRHRVGDHRQELHHRPERAGQGHRRLGHADEAGRDLRHVPVGAARQRLCRDSSPAA